MGMDFLKGILMQRESWKKTHPEKKTLHHMFRNFEDTSTQMSNNETFVWSWLICSFCARFLKALDLAARGLRIYWQKTPLAWAFTSEAETSYYQHLNSICTDPRFVSADFSYKHSCMKKWWSRTPPLGKWWSAGKPNFNKKSCRKKPRHHCEFAKDRRVLKCDGATRLGITPREATTAVAWRLGRARSSQCCLQGS